MQGLGNNEEARLRILGAYYALEETKIKRGLISSFSNRKQLLGSSVLAGLSTLRNGVATNSGCLGCHRSSNMDKKERIAVHATNRKACSSDEGLTLKTSML